MQSPKKRSFAAEQLKRQRKVNPVVWILVSAAAAALIIGGYLLYQRLLSERQVETETQQIKSLAVLPFVNIGGDPGQEAFCDGISDEIINRLTPIDRLRVIARTSSFYYKNKEVKIADIGKELDVEWVLEGSVRKAGNSLRVTVQLIRVSDQTHIFSETYDREMADIFSIQDDIAQAVVNELKVNLVESEEEALVRRYTNNSEAYELYLLGLGTDERTKKIELFEQALERDPNFALAYVGIALAYVGIARAYVFLHLIDDSEELNPKAKAAALKALEIDDTLAEAHIGLGRYYMLMDWDFPSAEHEIIRALSLNPGSYMAHFLYGLYLARIGNLEMAISELQRVIDINPRHSNSYYFMVKCKNKAGQCDEALKVLDTALQVDPEWWCKYWCLGRVELCKGNYSKAIDFFDTDYQVRNDPRVFDDLGYAYAVSGQTEKAHEIIANIKEQKFSLRIKSSTIAHIYIGLGETDRAFEWIERAYQERENSLLNIKVWLVIETISSDPRYKEILKKIGLPE